MKRWKKYAGLLLALVLCLSLTACGDGNANVNDNVNDDVNSSSSEAENKNDTAPATIEGIVIDDSVEYDYSIFLGEWSGGNDNVLAVEKFDDGRMHFTLSDANDDWIASGLFQYSQEYGYVYAHNDFDGIAYQCRFGDDDTLNIEYFGTFTKAGGDAPEPEKTADDAKAADAPVIFGLENLGDPVEYDYSAFLGKWVGMDGFTLTVEEDSGEGAPFTLLDRYGSPYTSGALRYVERYGCVYVKDNNSDVVTKCTFDENGRLDIPGFSTFSKVNGDESDYIVIYGTWYPGGDESATRCIEFDSSNTFWEMYERGANGLLDGVNGGTLTETGVNRYKAVSNWNEGQTFDFYLEGDTLYWGSENGGYEEYR